VLWNADNAGNITLILNDLALDPFPNAHVLEILDQVVVEV